MRYDELIDTCIQCLKQFNADIESPDSFVERFLKKITKDTNERGFIKQVFQGVLRYTQFLTIFTEAGFNSKPSSTERKDEKLFHIFAYLTIFRGNELPLDDYKQLVLSQDMVKLNEFFTFGFDTNILQKTLRPKWIECFDFNYIDTDIIGGLIETAKNIEDVLSYTLSKARAGNLSSTKDTESKVSSFKQQTFKQTTKQPTNPEPFNLTKPKPRAFQEPIAIPNYVKARPLGNGQKTNLKKIEEERLQRLNETKVKNEEKHNNEKKFEFKTEGRPTNFDKIAKEVNAKVEETLQFKNKYCNPVLDFSKIKADIKYNEAAILKEEFLISKKKQEEEKELEKVLIEKKDSKEYDRWIAEMKMKEDIKNMEKIQKRKIELELNREVATKCQEIRMKENQLRVAQDKKKKILNEKLREVKKAKELVKKRELVKEIDKEKENIIMVKEKQKQANQELYKNRIAEYEELDVIAREEKRIEKERRDDLIRQVRELEKLPMKRTSGFDPTETPGYGLLEEMSIVEGRERGDLQKRMLADQIKSKKEENKLKMEERTDMLTEKAEIIADHRDRQKNEKEIERKKKRDAIGAKEKLIKDIHEKNVFEVKQKIEAKKNQLRKEDEIFQKKIREIKLQRQYLKAGSGAVEEKAFKEIEDGLERKINNIKNQELIDQQKREAVSLNEGKLRYNAAKEDVNFKTNLLATYKQVYEKTKEINAQIMEEDKQIKSAKYDKERALTRIQNEVLKERNKYSDSLQASTLKTNNADQKSTISSKMNKSNLTNKGTRAKAAVDDNEDAGKEEENTIGSKLNNEAVLA